MSLTNARIALGVFALLLFTWWCYSPGLDSLFLYDDTPNLKSLSVIAPEPIFSASFWQFITSGTAGPLGRPLALFTFALQADAWPANPYAFKLVNCLLHLFNGTLVYLLCRQMAQLLRVADSAVSLFCFSVTALWLLHPIHVSTVLFSVQRMTLLASTFLLLGVLLHLRLRLATTIPDNKRVWLLSCSLAVTGVAGLLCKEMAAVLLCYLLALEYTVLASLPASRLLRWWRYGFLWLPVIVLVILAIAQWNSLQQNYAEQRDFTMLQKLLTEARVLWMYLQTLMTPSTASLSLFQWPLVSTSLLQPLTTLLALVCWLALVTVALLKRQRFPMLAFAVFWYLGGHLVESTLLPLSLMFNHRNYLPYLGPLLAIGYALSQLAWHGKPVAHAAKWALSTLLGLLFSVQLHQQSKLWSDPLELASNWYLANPTDSRSIEFLAIELAEQGEQAAPQVVTLYEQLVANNPGNYRFLLNRLLVSCKFKSIPLPDRGAIATTLQIPANFDNDIVNPLKQLVTLVGNQSCPGLEPALLDQIAERTALNADAKTRGLLAFERGRLALIESQAAGDPNFGAALQWFQTAFDLTQDPAVLFTQAQYRLAQNDKQSALALIAQAESMLFEYNDISTGTRATKLAALASLRLAANRAANAPGQ